MVITVHARWIPSPYGIAMKFGFPEPYAPGPHSWLLSGIIQKFTPNRLPATYSPITQGRTAGRRTNARAAA